MHSLRLRPPPPPSSLSPPLSSSSSALIYNLHFGSPPCSFLFSFRPNKRFHFLKPCWSLKQTKKQQQQSLQKTSAPQSLKWFFGPKGDGDDEKPPPQQLEGEGEGEGGEGGRALEGDAEVKGTILAGMLLVGVVGGLGTVGYVYRDQTNAFLTRFSTFIDGNDAYNDLIRRGQGVIVGNRGLEQEAASGYGPAGYALFLAFYSDPRNPRNPLNNVSWISESLPFCV